MTVYRTFESISGTIPNPELAYDKTQDDTTTACGTSSLSNVERIWRLTDSISGSGNVYFKIIRTYNTVLDFDRDSFELASYVSLSYRWDNIGDWVIIDSKSAGDSKSDFTQESFTIDTSGKNLNQLYIRSNIQGTRHFEKYDPEGSWAVAGEQYIYDMYISTTGGSSSNSTITQTALSTGVESFETANGKKAYSFNVQFSHTYTGDTSSGFFVASHQGTPILVYPEVTPITLGGAGTDLWSFNVISTGPVTIDYKMIDSNVLSVSLTHSDWSYLNDPARVNPYDTPIQVYSLDNVNNVDKIYGSQFSTASYHRIIKDAAMAHCKSITAFEDYSGTVAGTVMATSASHGLASGNTSVTISGNTSYNGTYTATKIDSNTFYFTKAFVATGTGLWYSVYYSDEIIQVRTQGLAYFMGFSDYGLTYRYYPTTGTFETLTTTALAYDETDASPEVGNEAASYITCMSSLSSADGDNGSTQESPQVSETITDIYKFTEAKTLVNPNIKIVWEGTAYNEGTDPITTFTEGGFENRGTPYKSYSSIEISYSIDTPHVTWNAISVLGGSDDYTNHAFANTETKNKGTSILGIVGDVDISKLWVKVTQTSRGNSAWSYYSESWHNIASVDAHTSINVYAIYVEAAEEA